MAKTSLLHQQNPLAIAQHQLQVLAGTGQHAHFHDQLVSTNGELLADRIEILQVNLGKLCNMTCAHCHVDAGPDRKEVMTAELIDLCVDVLRRHPEISTVDLTGGAPEMNPQFRSFVSQARELDRHVIDRCNLTILLAKGFEDTAEFLASNQVEIVASLPCYLEENTDAQRGNGAFSKSIQSLRKLNDLGYGSDLVLTLVFNPVGASLPPQQAVLEDAYRKELKERYNIAFTRLFTIVNMPISRFLDHLLQTGEYDRYMQTLIDAFNPGAISGLMCRNTLSVGWDGKLYDCDFNQMLELDVTSKRSAHIRDFNLQDLARRKIVTGQHCYGCTAGAGSGCQGAISPS